MSTTTLQNVPTDAAHSDNQWPANRRLRKAMTRSTLAQGWNNETAEGPHATVNVAVGYRSKRSLNNPVDRIASPTRLEVTNRIFNAPLDLPALRQAVQAKS